MVSGVPQIAGYSELVEIGRGGQARVFRARHQKLGRIVALKVLHGFDGSPSALRQFQREGEALVAFGHHPAVVQVHDVDVTADERPYIAMEYCPGGSFEQVGPVPIDEVLEVGRAVAWALGAVHEAGLLHRDVKPSNVLRGQYGPKLGDFGIARAAGLSTTTLAPTFTPVHAPPELFQESGATQQSDLWSLGSTLYTLLEGHPPFGSDEVSLLALMHRITTQDVPPLTRTDVPEYLRAAVLSTLARDPAQRPPSADALRLVLAGVQPDQVRATVRAPGARSDAARAMPTERIGNPQIPTAVAATAVVATAAIPTAAVPTAAVPTGAISTASQRRDVAVEATPGLRSEPKHQRRRRATALVGTLLVVALSVAAVAQRPDDPPSQPLSAVPAATALPEGSTMAAIRSRGRIIIGTRFDQPLFGQANESGQPEGFDIEIGRLVASAILGDDAKDGIEFVDTPLAREEAIVGGKVDLVVATFTMSALRKDQVSFAGPYYVDGRSILVRGDDATIVGLSSLGEKKVCTQVGSATFDSLRERVPTADLSVQFDLISKCADALKAGRVDAVSDDRVNLLGALQANPGQVKLTGSTFDGKRYGVGVKKGDTVFRDFINAVLQRSFADGTWSKAFETHVGVPTGIATPLPPRLDPT